MTQRIFDIENEKDMQDLWDIVPAETDKITIDDDNASRYLLYDKDDFCIASISGIIQINWHDKTEITRPVYYEDMIGCVGWFWDDSKADDTSPCLGVLTVIAGGEYYTQVETWGYDNFRPAKKSELKFWGEDK